VFLFYSEEIEEDTIQLDEIDTKHCLKVLRKKAGDLIDVTDGKGIIYLCEIKDTERRKLRVIVVSKKESPIPKVNLAIAIAPTKNQERLEWFLEKSIEIGINEIFMINTARTEKTHLKYDRLQRIAIAAMKQSYNVRLPIIHELSSLDKVMSKVANYKYKFIAHCLQPQDHLSSFLPIDNSAVLFIGPEGDFSTEEVTLCLDAGFKEVSLGDSRLRTETAAIVGVTILNLPI
jgi:16S rRNA (uracil1498-N3)-methyltransferase